MIARPHGREGIVEPHAAEPHAAEVARLEALGEGRPGAPVFPALAEAHRRAGDAEKAAHVAREGLAERPDLPAGRVALALALLDLGRLDEAREELARVLDEVPAHARARAALEAQGEPASEPLGGLDEGELEAAFEAAESDPEEMVDANHVAEAALRQVERGTPEGVDVVREGSPFATETVAALLERQGHGDQARVVRETAARRSATADPARRQTVLATLERWLDNVRRRVR
jgi:tetratricopeptide (TPR) repeat protein